MKELMKYKKIVKACISLIPIKNSVIDVLKETKSKVKDLEIKKMIVNTINRER